MSNIVAIIGRPNVGKSTFFNRLTKSREAIVHESSGVTRDRHYGQVEWNGYTFSLIDTGGLVTNSDDVFEGEIKKQVDLAIEEADILIFLVDVQSGITDLDQEIANMLRKVKKPIFLVINKVDTYDKVYDSHEFYKFGMDNLFTISSMNGSGTGDLLDAVVNAFPKAGTLTSDIIEDELPKLAIVGRPNVGKSSLINSLIGDERNIVTPIAGTTRDTIHSRYTKFGHDFWLVDTAGVRKKGKVEDDVEFYSVMRSIKAIENADVCLLMLDATRGIEAQDVNIFHIIERNNKGVVILVNKWDLVEKETQSTIFFEKAIKERLAPFNDVPIVFVSALTKQRLFKALETAIQVFENRKKKIPTPKLNDVMLEIIEKYPPPMLKGKYVKIKYVTQIGTYYPSFIFFCNLPQYVKESYRRYLENRLREKFDFTGVPIQLYFRKK